ncbi:BRCT domain-containing protein [Pedobacter sp. 22226]|uniref:BRCT domain-containing protein n=1 Tax=Pedobacter sp. 22226 TaxID=3453894 RepID=UPI003F86B5AF
MKQPDQLILDMYTSKAQADKAISSLKGILLGINLDGDINEQIRRETERINISGLCTSEPDVTFDGKTFCITGILQRTSREGLKKKILNQGGIPTDGITLKTDYLIIGDNGNPAWAFSCYGRKVEKAINMRKDGHTIMLIHEFDFADVIDELITSA